MMKKLIIIINLLLLSLFAWMGVAEVYRGFTGAISGMEQEPLRVSPRDTGEAAPEKKIKSIRFYSAIDRRNLFRVDAVGSAPEKPKQEKKVELEGLKETKLMLSLLGTVFGSEGSGRAVILDKKKRKQDIYREGDTVTGAEVKVILRGKVVLRVNGKDEILTMEDAGSGSSKKGPVRPAKTEKPVRSGTGIRMKLSRALVEESMEDMGRLMSQVRVRPYIRNGNPEGFVVSHIKGGSLFAKAGIRNGDIITGINGEKIDSIDSAMAQYGALKSSDNVKLSIKRRGREQVIEYTIED